MSQSTDWPGSFVVETWFWARVLPLLCLKSKSFADILQVGRVGSSRRYGGLSVEAITDRVKRVARHPWLMRDRRCLREGMLAFRFLTLAGIPAKIHFGVDRDSVSAPVLSAHCWISVNGEVVMNPPSDRMVTIYVRQNELTG